MTQTTSLLAPRHGAVTPRRSFRLAALALALATAAAPTAARAGQVVSVETTGVTPGALFAVTATGLDAAAANNEFTFTPPAGAPVTLAATSSAQVDATRGVRRISVRVPAGLETGTATVRVRNTVTGETTEVGTINILSLSVPGLRTGAPGATSLLVTLRAGGAANFVAGQTRVTFGAGITVRAVSVLAPNELQATIDIAAGAADGPRTVSVTVPRQSLILANAFAVAAAAPANQPPTARFTVSPGTAQTGTLVTVDASASTDPEGDALTYEWSFGDTAAATGVTASHAYATAATFTLSLTVRDGRGGVGTATQPIVITTPPPVNREPMRRSRSSRPRPARTRPWLSMRADPQTPTATRCRTSGASVTAPPAPARRRRTPTPRQRRSPSRSRCATAAAAPARRRARSSSPRRHPRIACPPPDSPHRRSRPRRSSR